MSNEYFKLTPVSEKPEKDGWYEVQAIDAPEGIARECFYYFDGNWYDSDRDAKNGAEPLGIIPDKNVYLRPASLRVQDGEAKVYKSMLEQILLQCEYGSSEVGLIKRIAKIFNDNPSVVIGHNPVMQSVGIMYNQSTPTPTVTTQGEGSIELFKHIWNSRNPAHELNTTTGLDMFWQTAEMIAREYVASLPAAGGPGDAINFAEWLYQNGYRYENNGNYWWNVGSKGTPVSLTTSDLFKEFKNL